MLNSSTNTTDASPYDEIQPFQGAILGIIATPGIVGNIFALVVTAKLLKVQKLTINVFVFGLCLCDLAGLLTICIPTWICYIFGGWQGGKHLCDFQGFATLLFSMGSGMMANLDVNRPVSLNQGAHFPPGQSQHASRYPACRYSSHFLGYLCDHASPGVWKFRPKSHRDLLYHKLVR